MALLVNIRLISLAKKDLIPTFRHLSRCPLQGMKCTANSDQLYRQTKSEVMTTDNIQWNVGCVYDQCFQQLFIRDMYKDGIDPCSLLRALRWHCTCHDSNRRR